MDAPARPLSAEDLNILALENDVVAGPIALLVFGFLALAVVVLAFSFRKQLRKAQAAREEGVYGDPPAPASSEDAPTQS